MAFKTKLTIDQGADFRYQTIYRTGASLTTTTPVDLTGYKAQLQARVDIADPTPLFELTTENGGITLNAVPGAIDLFISDVDTAAMNFETAVFDLFLTAPGTDGDRAKRLYGTVSLVPSVTR